MSKVYKCDRCGVIIPDAEFCNSSGIAVVRYGHIYDLCPECKKQLQEWMKEYSKKEVKKNARI